MRFLGVLAAPREQSEVVLSGRRVALADDFRFDDKGAAGRAVDERAQTVARIEEQKRSEPRARALLRARRRHESSDLRGVDEREHWRIAFA